MSAISYLHVLSPLHTGTGQGTGIIDLPIARETTTNWPEIPGSSLKGALRSAADGVLTDARIKEMFGPDISRNEDPSESSGKVWFGGARILCFPVRSFAGTFAWVTCPLALMSWKRDLETIGIQQTIPPFSIPTGNQVHTSTDSRLMSGPMVFLEEIDLRNSSTHETQTLAAFLADSVFEDENWQEFFTKRLAIVADDVFTYLVSMTTTVSTRIRLEDARKTVADGQMWYEETVPPEAIFWHPIVDNDDAFSNDLKDLFARSFQVGGNATVGQGMVQGKLAIAGGGNENA